MPQEYTAELTEYDTKTRYWVVKITGPNLPHPGYTQVRKPEGAQDMALDWLETYFDVCPGTFTVRVLPPQGKDV